MTKKKKNSGINGGLLVLVILCMVAAVFGYSFILFLQERNAPVTEYPPTPPTKPEPNPQPTPTKPENPSVQRPDLQLYQTRLAEWEKTIGKINASVEDALEHLSLRIDDAATDRSTLEIYDGINLNWAKTAGTIRVPSEKYSLSDVSGRLITAVQAVGGTMIRTGQDGKNLTLVLGLITEDTEIITHQLTLQPEPQKVTPVKPHVEAKAKLAFIIDDLGYEWPEFDRMMTIPRPMTFAVIPHLPYSTQQAKRVWAQGFDLIMHQPMQPTSKDNPGEGAIYTTMSEEEIIQTLSDNLASLPQGLIGVNNHMGSKATSDPRVMEIVLRFFRDRGMFFVDSHTSPDTVVAEVARDVGETFGENRLFLDNVDELEAIKEQIRKVCKIALRDGYAITIGHVRKYTAKAILSMIDEIEGMGIEIVPAKELLERY